MSLEAGTYISDLISSNPTGTDPRRQGDDHIRLLKSVLLATFPNVTGAVTATQAQLNLLTDLSNFTPSGIIVEWSGSEANIPSGWQLCNGTGTTTLGDAIPDLRSVFILGSSGDAGLNATGTSGGSFDINIGATTDAHALTVAEMPSHSHQQRGSGQDWDQGGVQTNRPFNSSTNAGAGGTTNCEFTLSAGSGSGHTHGITYNGTNANIPTYYALAKIIKL